MTEGDILELRPVVFDANVVPRHVALIMDGSWAARGLPRFEGHWRGVEALRRAVRAAIELNISFLTVYSFSVENCSRLPEEVRSLLGLLNRFIRNDLPGCWCANSLLAVFFPSSLGSLDANGNWHTEARHPVEDIASDLCLGPLIGQSPGVKTTADDGLVSILRRFDQAASRISGTPLPADASVLCDGREMLIALRCRSLARNGR